jgi:1-acyl-sn-glycerol-3-phosphate acyltransferase
MNHLLKPFQVLYTLYALLLFVAILLLIFPLVVLASLFGRVTGGNFIYRLCRLWADIMYPLLGMWHTNIYDAPHNPGHPCVFVFNHISYFDIPVIMKSIRRQHFRVLGKAEMASFPIFGFVYRNAVVMVNRSSAEHRAKSVQQLKSILSKGISVLIAPEGTFNTTGRPLKEFYDGAFRVAIETQTPIKPLLFMDAYNRLHFRSIFSLTPGSTTTVFLDEIAVAGMTLEDLPALKEQVYRLMEEKLITYKAGWIQ